MNKAKDKTDNNLISSSIEEAKQPTTPPNDPNFDRKLDLVTAGARPYIKDHLLTRISRQNCITIVNYMLAMQTEVGPAERYRIDTIYKLKLFAEFHNPKPFEEITRQDVIDFLDRLRKPETVDPLHQWQGTYELSRIVLLRFFRWLYYEQVVPHSKRPTPAVMQNIPKLTRKEKSIYKPTDMWTPEEDFIFYKYCPSVRDRCWHAVSRDTGCRPHELLKLKIKDVVVQQLDNGYQIARIPVNGKTGQRSVRLNNAYPRLKEWLGNGHHPYSGNPNAPLFCGTGKKSIGRRTTHAIYAAHAHYKQVVFPKVLEDPLVPEEDKRKIRDMLKKPWNPHARRHTSATEISKVIKDPILLNDYFGWSQTGNTRLKYQHYFADDTIDAMLTIMDGLPPLPSQTEQNKKKDLLKPIQCPHCAETNTPESKFCVKCKFVLSFDLYSEVTKEAEQRTKEVEALKARLDHYERQGKYSEQAIKEITEEFKEMKKYFDSEEKKQTKRQIAADRKLGEVMLESAELDGKIRKRLYY
jgi:integrase/recombinase XerD